MPEASFADLQKAISGFNDEVKTYAIQSAFTNASQNVKQLQQANLDENEKFNQTRQLSDQLALQLSGLGATGEQINTAYKITQPDSFNTPEAMFSQALVSGDEKLRKKAIEFKDFADKNKMEMAHLKFSQSLAAQESKQKLMDTKEFKKLVPKYQEQYNRATKDYATKVGQIQSILSLPPSSIKDRLELTTMVKSIGQDVGNIGEKEAEQVLGSTAAGQFKQFRNYITGAANSVRTPEQAYQVLKVFNKSASMMEKLMNNKANNYAYQLTKSAKLYGHSLNLQEAKDMLVNPDLGVMGDNTSEPQQSSGFTPNPISSAPNQSVSTPAAPNPNAFLKWDN